MKLANIGVTFLLGLAGGTLFFLLHLPLPWILGSAFAVMTMNALRPQRIEWPKTLGEAGIIVVAFKLGQTVTVDTLRTIWNDLPGMILSSIMWICICLAIGLLFSKAAGISKEDGILGCVPGGLSQMVMIADGMKGANPGNVAIIQTARLVVVLYTVPFLAASFAGAGGGEAAAALPETAAAAAAASASWPAAAGYAALPVVPLIGWLAKRCKLPAGEFIGPFLLVGALAAAGMAWPEVPDGALSLAQVLIGIFIGQRVQPAIMWKNKRLGPLSFASAAFLVGLTAAAAWILTTLTSASIVTWFLALAPGGLGDVAVTALVLDADVQQVTAYQIFRLVIVLVAAPPFLRLVLRKNKHA